MNRNLFVEDVSMQCSLINDLVKVQRIHKNISMNESFMRSVLAAPWCQSIPYLDLYDCSHTVELWTL